MTVTITGNTKEFDDSPLTPQELRKLKEFLSGLTVDNESIEGPDVYLITGEGGSVRIETNRIVIRPAAFRYMAAQFFKTWWKKG